MTQSAASPEPVETRSEESLAWESISSGALLSIGIWMDVHFPSGRAQRMGVALIIAAVFPFIKSTIRWWTRRDQ